MTRLWLVLGLLGMMLAAGCHSETPLGPCIGAFDDGDPKLVYKADTLNVLAAVLFVETVVVPLIVVLTETRCPVERRP